MAETEGKKGGDLIVHLESFEYCCVSAKLQAPAGAASNVANVVGYPVKLDLGSSSGLGPLGVYELLIQGQEANCVGLIVAGPPIVDLSADAFTSSEYLILIHPPAVVNQNQIQLVDCQGAALTSATLYTALRNKYIQLRTEPTKKSTQSE